MNKLLKRTLGIILLLPAIFVVGFVSYLFIFVLPVPAQVVGATVVLVVCTYNGQRLLSESFENKSSDDEQR